MFAVTLDNEKILYIKSARTEVEARRIVERKIVEQKSPRTVASVRRVSGAQR